jgi:hypothetical protein
MICENLFEMNPCMSKCVCKMNLKPDPCYTMCMILFISPSVGGVGLVEYVRAHPCLTNCFSEEDPDFVPEDVE